MTTATFQPSSGCGGSAQFAASSGPAGRALIPTPTPGNDIVDLALDATHRDAAEARELLAYARERITCLEAMLDAERRAHALTKGEKTALHGRLLTTNARLTRADDLSNRLTTETAELRASRNEHREIARGFRMSCLEADAHLTEALEALEDLRANPPLSLCGRLVRRLSRGKRK